jgi:putative hydrolase of the HAD superfamily
VTRRVPARIRDSFEVILFDMNGTFMFGADRFGAGEDFHRTYVALGGSELAPDEVERAIRGVLTTLGRAYEDPARFDDFVTVAEGLLAAPGRWRRTPSELELLVAVFAEHEVGRVPDGHARYLRDLSSGHRLGVVSNIWAPKARWLREFERAGLANVFESVVFSSDTRSVKPSPALFLSALEAFGVSPTNALFVGDSVEREITPARALGLRTAWIAGVEGPLPETRHDADFVLRSILDLDASEPPA